METVKWVDFQRSGRVRVRSVSQRLDYQHHSRDPALNGDDAPDETFSPSKQNSFWTTSPFTSNSRIYSTSVLITTGRLYCFLCQVLSAAALPSNFRFSQVLHRMITLKKSSEKSL